MKGVKAKAGWYVVGDKKVWLDSEEEYKFITRLVANGFSGKWERTVGVRYGRPNYTVDFVLDALWEGSPRKVFIEYKSQSAQQFRKVDRTRAIAALHYYGKDPCYSCTSAKPAHGGVSTSTRNFSSAAALRHQLCRRPPFPGPSAIGMSTRTAGSTTPRPRLRSQVV